MKILLSLQLKRARERHAKIRDMNIRPGIETDATRRLRSKLKETSGDNNRILFTQKPIAKTKIHNDLLFLPFTFLPAASTSSYNKVFIAHKTNNAANPNTNPAEHTPEHVQQGDGIIYKPKPADSNQE